MGNDDTLIGTLDTWKYAAVTTIYGDILFGVKIDNYRWIDTGKYALCREPQGGILGQFPVYHVKIKRKMYEFAAYEITNGVFLYFVRNDGEINCG